MSWVGALVADLVINKPLGLSPPMIEFKRAHLYDINPVGVGSMVLASLAGLACVSGLFGPMLESLAAFVALAASFVIAPTIAWITKGRYYIARTPRRDWSGELTIRCVICEHQFEAEDMAQCPAYSGAICSLCCSLESRCRDCCKPQARLGNQTHAVLGRLLPQWALRKINTDVGHYAGVLTLFAGVIGIVLMFVYFQVSFDTYVNKDILRSTLWTVFFILSIIAGIAAWLFVLAHESRRVAEDETRRQTELLMREIEAHQRTDAKLQKAKEVAEAASNAKSRHVAGLSHELRTPLNAILGYARILERDPDIPPRRVDALKVVRRSAEHLSGLIDGLLDISKIEAGRFHLNRDEVSIGDFITQVVDMFRPQANAKNIAFQFIPARNMPAVVHTDENRLRQILINLLSNAIKFTDRGQVTLRVAYRNQVARFDVEDTGIGIARDDIERIFQPFERAHAAPDGTATGTGLGLTITKLLVETMGGEIRVASTPGKGSTFSVKLMLAEVARPRIASTLEDEVRGYAGPRQTVLVVDDNPTQRDMIVELLRPLGFTVLAAGSGQDALAVVGDTTPDMSLIDVSMPDMDGWELGARLRKTLPERCAIVMLSALAPDKSPQVGPERIHDDYLMKPLNLRQLLEKIRALLDIEWVYAADGDAPAPEAAPPLARSPLPPRADIDALIRLGHIGQLRGIEDKLSEIRRASPTFETFVAQLAPMVESVDLPRLVSALEALRSDNAEG